MDKGSSRNSEDCGGDGNSLERVDSVENYIPTTEDLNVQGRTSEAGFSINGPQGNNGNGASNDAGSESNFGQGFPQHWNYCFHAW